MRSVSIIYLTMAIMFAGVCVLDVSVERSRPPIPRSDSAFHALAGEFRTVAANLLWIKADKYHHEFIAHGGNWSQNKDILPLIRLITDLDPYFVEAYLTGGWILATGLDLPDEAVRFLKAGILSNPNSSELHEGLGTLYAGRLGEPHEGLKHLERALSLARDDFDTQRLTRLINSVRRMCEELDEDQPPASEA